MTGGGKVRTHPRYFYTPPSFRKHLYPSAWRYRQIVAEVTGEIVPYVRPQFLLQERLVRRWWIAELRASSLHAVVVAEA